MTITQVVRRAGAAVLVAALAVTHPDGIVETRQEPAVGVALPGVAPPAVRELCAGSSGRWQVAIVGPRVKFSRGVPADGRTERQRELTARVLSVATQHPDAFIAADGSWVAFSDPTSNATYAYECAAGLLERIPVSGRIRRLAVSQAGDVAMLTDAGLVLSVQPEAQEKGWSRAGGSAVSQVGRALGRPVVPGFDAAQADDLVWHGRQLMIVARTSIFRLVPRGVQGVNVYEHTEPAGTPADTVEHAFVYKGLTYVLRSDGCFDVLVGDGLSPHLPRVACLPAGVARESYLSVDPERVSAVDRTNVRASLPRASVYTIVLSGGTRLIAENLTRLIAERWIPRVPIGSPATPAPPDVIPDGWRQSFAKEMWSSPADYERTLETIHRLGWAPLTAGKPWHTAPGVAFRWNNSVAVQTTAGRSLSQLARDLYHEQTYDDRQVNSIVANNAPLSRSLEASIVKQGWRAVATGHKQGGPAPALLLPVQRHSLLKIFKRSSEPELFNPECFTATDGAPETALTEAVRRGLPFVGSLEPHVMSALGQPTQVEILGERVRSVPCPGAFGSPRASLLVIDGIKLRASKGDGVAAKINAPVVWADVRLKASDDPDWPIAVTTPGVIGYRTADGADGPARATREWLERILPHFAGRLVVPVTSLYMAVAIDASITPEKGGRPAVTLMSAEVVPAKAMSSTRAGCDSTQSAVDQRRKHEQSMGFPDPAAMPRDAGVIAVAENAVDVLNTLFVTPGGVNVWVRPDENGEFVPVLPPLPSEKTLRPPSFLTHGTQVAALLLAHGAVPGLLNKAELTWFDLQESDPFANQVLFTQLFGRHAVLNVSQRLLAEDSWSWLRDRISQSSDQILVVAAAPNIKEPTEGSPLAWKSHAPVNIVGIGAANPDGSVPDQATYKRQFVDLLAPGAEVPTFDHTGTLDCTDGTSFATAYATAAIAMLMERVKQPVPAIRARLFATAVWRDSYASKVKAGHIDIGRALDGINDNVLTVDRGQGSTTDLIVEINNNTRLTFDGTTFVGAGETTETFTVPWKDILRLERRSDDGAQKIYRLHALVQKQYRIFHNVRIATDAVAGVTSCRLRKASEGAAAPDCTGLRVATIRDYVAGMLVPRSVLEFP